MVIDILRYAMIVCFVVMHLYWDSLHLASEPRDVMLVLYYHDRSKRKHIVAGLVDSRSACCPPSRHCSSVPPVDDRR